MKIGASYYPEVMEESEWSRDLATGAALGLNVLRCGEFAWSSLFSTDGKPKMDWARRFLDVAESQGYEVIWCTPSATPPPFVFDRWPDLVATNQDGHVLTPGVRRNYCPSHPGYLDLCEELAQSLVRNLGSHPAIRGWQVDNELAGDGFTCWCPRCGAAFQHWLEERYGSLDHLNRAWQTRVWSQVYTRWEQIPVPLLFRPSHAPALKLAWRRFRSDNWMRFYRRQADAMRASGARQITTNFYNMAWDVPFDRWQWRPHLDALGLSHYLEQPDEQAFELAVLQGPMPGEKPLWVLEQKAGQQASQNLLPDDLDRVARHLSGCAEASAEYGIYWHLRQHAAGCEMEHGAVLRHDGCATRVAKAIAGAIKRAAATQPAFASAERLLVFSFQQHWANETRPPIGAPYDYRLEVQENWFAATRRVFGSIRVGNFDAANGGSLIIAPFFQMDEPGAAETFRDAVQRGATLLVTADFLRLDPENNVRRIAPLGAIAPWLDVPSLELYHLRAGTVVQGTFDGKEANGRTFWAIPEASPAAKTSWNFVGQGACEGLEGPLAMEARLGRGRIVVALSALDVRGVEALLRRA